MDTAATTPPEFLKYNRQLKQSILQISEIKYDVS